MARTAALAIDAVSERLRPLLAQGQSLNEALLDYRTVITDVPKKKCKVDRLVASMTSLEVGDRKLGELFNRVYLGSDKAMHELLVGITDLKFAARADFLNAVAEACSCEFREGP